MPPRFPLPEALSALPLPLAGDDYGVLAALRHESLPAAPWVPFAGVHAGKLKGYEVIVLVHSAGHSTPPAEMKDVFAWIEAVIDGKKTTLVTRRIDDSKTPKHK